jgi:hypothetical protein
MALASKCTPARRRKRELPTWNRCSAIGRDGRSSFTSEQRLYLPHSSAAPSSSPVTPKLTAWRSQASEQRGGGQSSRQSDHDRHSHGLRLNERQASTRSSVFQQTVRKAHDRFFCKRPRRTESDRWKTSSSRSTGTTAWSIWSIQPGRPSTAIAGEQVSYLGPSLPY